VKFLDPKKVTANLPKRIKVTNNFAVTIFPKFQKPLEIYKKCLKIQEFLEHYFCLGFEIFAFIPWGRGMSQKLSVLIYLRLNWPHCRKTQYTRF